MSAMTPADLAEQLRVSFVIFCDENDLSVEAGVALAEDIGNELVEAAEDRVRYVA